MTEHAYEPPAPAVIPEPAARAVAAAPFTVLATPEHVLALQRTAGNRATTAVLQRSKRSAAGTSEPIAPDP